MKVLVVSDVQFDRHTGLARAARNLVSALTDAAVQVAVVVPTATSKGDPSQGYFTSGRIPMYAVPTRSVRLASHQPVPRPIAARRIARTAFDEWGPEVVHVMTPFVIGLAALREGADRGVPSVLAFHLLPSNAVGQSPILRGCSPVARAAMALFYGRASRHAAIIGAPSAAGAHFARRFTKSDKPYVVVSNGVTPLARLQTKPTAAATGNSTRLLYVGRLAREKRVEVLITALQLLPKHCRTTLVVVGDGAQRRKLERLADRNVRHSVIFRGHISDEELADEYRRADLFCMPSTNELECIAALEALSFGLPIVAASSLALKDLPAWSKACVPVLPGSPEAMARGIDLLLSDDTLRRDLARNALVACDARSLKSTAAAWCRVYGDLTDLARATGINSRDLGSSARFKGSF